MLPFDSDLAEEWVLKLWEAAPTPAKAARLLQAEVEKLLKRHRIRRIDAAKVLAILNQQALVVAPDVTEAAVAHTVEHIVIGRARNGRRNTHQAKNDMPHELAKDNLTA